MEQKAGRAWSPSCRRCRPMTEARGAARVAAVAIAVLAVGVVAVVAARAGPVWALSGSSLASLLVELSAAAALVAAGVVVCVRGPDGRSGGCSRRQVYCGSWRSGTTHRALLARSSSPSGSRWRPLPWRRWRTRCSCTGRAVARCGVVGRSDRRLRRQRSDCWEWRRRSSPTLRPRAARPARRTCFGSRRDLPEREPAPMGSRPARGRAGVGDRDRAPACRVREQRPPSAGRPCRDPGLRGARTRRGRRAHSWQRGFLSNDPVDRRLWLLQALAIWLVVRGVVWQRLAARRFRAALTRVVVELADSPRPGGLRDALADALGDPDLELLHAQGDGWIDGKAARGLFRSGRRSRRPSWCGTGALSPRSYTGEACSTTRPGARARAHGRAGAGARPPSRRAARAARAAAGLARTSRRRWRRRTPPTGARSARWRAAGAGRSGDGPGRRPRRRDRSPARGAAEPHRTRFAGRSPSSARWRTASARPRWATGARRRA